MGLFFFTPPRVAGQGGGPGGISSSGTRGAHLLIAHRGADSGAMAEEQRDLMSDRGSGMLSLGDTQRCWGQGVWGGQSGHDGDMGQRGHCMAVGWKGLQLG